MAAQENPTWEFVVLSRWLRLHIYDLTNFAIQTNIRFTVFWLLPIRNLIDSTLLLSFSSPSDKRHTKTLNKFMAQINCKLLSNKLNPLNELNAVSTPRIHDCEPTYSNDTAPEVAALLCLLHRTTPGHLHRLSSGAYVKWSAGCSVDYKHISIDHFLDVASR